MLAAAAASATETLAANDLTPTNVVTAVSLALGGSIAGYHLFRNPHSEPVLAIINSGDTSRLNVGEDGQNIVMGAIGKLHDKVTKFLAEINASSAADEKKIIKLKEKLARVAKALFAAVDRLCDRYDKELSELNIRVDKVEVGLAHEADDRKAGDATLQLKHEEEVDDRKAGDATLRLEHEKEVDDRKAGEAALQEQVIKMEEAMEALRKENDIKQKILKAKEELAIAEQAVVLKRQALTELEDEQRGAAEYGEKYVH